MHDPPHASRCLEGESPSRPLPAASWRSRALSPLGGILQIHPGRQNQSCLGATNDESCLLLCLPCQVEMPTFSTPAVTARVNLTKGATLKLLKDVEKEVGGSKGMPLVLRGCCQANPT